MLAGRASVGILTSFESSLRNAPRIRIAHPFELTIRMLFNLYSYSIYIRPQRC
jgi:hypothetical protein